MSIYLLDSTDPLEWVLPPVCEMAFGYDGHLTAFLYGEGEDKIDIDVALLDYKTGRLHRRTIRVLPGQNINVPLASCPRGRFACTASIGDREVASASWEGGPGAAASLVWFEA
jgi:hypothetical protein